MEELVRKDPYWSSWGLAILAYSFWYQGEYTRSFDLVFEAIKNAEKEKSPNIGRTFYALGIFYFDTNDLEASHAYFSKTLEAYKQHGIIYGVARVMNNLASIAIRQNKIEDAITLLESSQGIYRTLGHHAGLSRVLNDLGMIEKTKGHYEKAYSLFQEAIDLRKEISHAQGLVTTYTELGETYLLEGSYDKALHYLNEGLRYSKEINSKQKGIRLHKLLSDVYKVKQNIPAAFEHHEAFYQFKSELLSDEATNTIKKLQSRFEKEKAEQEAEIERLRNVELKQANDIIKHQNIELQDTIDELTRVKISRKAITLTLIVGVALFFLSEGLLDPLIDNYSQSMWYGLFAKLLIALILKPIETLFEKILLRRVSNRRTKQIQTVESPL
jgi:tetratricopeptide (TPR) repeat protein